MCKGHTLFWVGLEGIDGCHMLWIHLHYAFGTLSYALRCPSFEQVTITSLFWNRSFLRQTILRNTLWATSPWVCVQALLKSRCRKVTWLPFFMLKDILKLHSFWQWTHFSTILIYWCYHLLIFFVYLDENVIFFKFYIFLITHKVGQLLICLWVKVAQSCLTPCDPMDIHGCPGHPGQNTGVGSLSLLQGIFPTQGSNLGLPSCRQILYQLSHKGSPRRLEWVAYPFSSRSSWPRNWTGSPALQADSLPAELVTFYIPSSMNFIFIYFCLL